jgi:hypothetical protein
VPSAYYLSRARDVPDYSDLLPEATMTYLVSYDSGDGLVNESVFTLKVAESGLAEDSVTTYRTVTEYDPLPKRKVNAIIVGSTTLTLGEDEIWRDEDDLRILHKETMQVDLPIVNTAQSQLTYSGYEGHPGWPYSLGDTWTYAVLFEPDIALQPDWTDSYRAEVVADDEIIYVGDVEFECFKVVHTLVETTSRVPAGAGVGSTLVEHWPRDGRSIAPLKVETTVDFVGMETRILVDADPMPPL